MSNSIVYAWGNSQEGQLGTGSDNLSIPTAIDFLPGRTPKSIATGLSHTLFIDSQGLVYSCGNNDHGQLGHNKRRLRPELIDSLEVFKIKQVACGSFHSLALTEDGQVLSWGLGDRGQLGHGLEMLGSLPRPKFIKAFANDRIVQIACGTKHCLALGEDGKVWAWGENSSGQLGNGNFVYSHTPTVVASLQGRPIKKIACGASHSVVLSFSGKLYFWGENNFGQLGTGNNTKSLRPQIMKNVAGSGVIDVVCGENHTAFLTKEGRVFTFGAGSNGQLGHQGYDHECEPKLVYDLPQEPASIIACGRRHTIVYQPKSHKLFSFGLNGSGQLGQSVGE